MVGPHLGCNYLYNVDNSTTAHVLEYERNIKCQLKKKKLILKKIYIYVENNLCLKKNVAYFIPYFLIEALIMSTTSIKKKKLHLIDCFRLFFFLAPYDLISDKKKSSQVNSLYYFYIYSTTPSVLKNQNPDFCAKETLILKRIWLTLCSSCPSLGYNFKWV